MNACKNQRNLHDLHFSFLVAFYMCANFSSTITHLRLQNLFLFVVVKRTYAIQAVVQMQ